MKYHIYFDDDFGRVYMVPEIENIYGILSKTKIRLRPTNDIEEVKSVSLTIIRYLYKYHKNKMIPYKIKVDEY